MLKPTYFSTEGPCYLTDMPENATCVAQIDALDLSDVRDTVGDVTFGQLQGHWLKSKLAPEIPKPYERALWFQANMAISKAKREGWIKEVPHIPQTKSDDCDYDQELMARWFAKMDAADEEAADEEYRCLALLGRVALHETWPAS